MKNPYRAFAAILVLLLVIAGVIFIILKANNPSNGTAPTDQLTEDPATPEPTPTPYPVPEGKAMEPFLVVIDPGHGGRDGEQLQRTMRDCMKRILCSISRKG